MKLHRSISSRALPLVLLAALAGSASAQFHGLPTPTNTVNWRTFRTGTTSRISGQTMFVLHTENDFVSYWSRSTGQSGETAPRGVDWNKEKLVAIHLGNRPSSGFKVFVRSIDRGPSLAVIRAVEQTPIPGQYVAQVVSSPFVIVRVDKNAADYRLELSREEGQVGNGVIMGPGGISVRPDYDAPSAPWVDPRFACDWSTLTSGSDCRTPDSGLFVLNSENDLQRYWERQVGRFASTAPRGVDWLRYKLVAVHLGERPNGGFGIAVQGVQRRGAYGIIHTVEETPIPGSFVSREKSRPFVIIKVERSVVQFKLDQTSRPRGGGGITIFGNGRGR